jgi:hypothetical protein
MGLALWLRLGIATLLLVPLHAWNNAMIGSLPYWLLVAPSISLALLHRQRIAAALSAFLVRGRRRRKPSARQQASRRRQSSSRLRRLKQRPAALITG